MALQLLVSGTCQRRVPPPTMWLHQLVLHHEPSGTPEHAPFVDELLYRRFWQGVEMYLHSGDEKLVVLKQSDAGGLMVQSRAQ